MLPLLGVHTELAEGLLGPRQPEPQLRDVRASVKLLLLRELLLRPDATLALESCVLLVLTTGPLLRLEGVLLAAKVRVEGGLGLVPGRCG